MLLILFAILVLAVVGLVLWACLNVIAYLGLMAVAILIGLPLFFAVWNWIDPPRNQERARMAKALRDWSHRPLTR